MTLNQYRHYAYDPDLGQVLAQLTKSDSSQIEESFSGYYAVGLEVSG